MSKTLQHDQLPTACQKYLEHAAAQAKAWEGASFKDRVTPGSCDLQAAGLTFSLPPFPPPPTPPCHTLLPPLLLPPCPGGALSVSQECIPPAFASTWSK